MSFAVYTEGEIRALHQQTGGESKLNHLKPIYIKNNRLSRQQMELLIAIWIAIVGTFTASLAWKVYRNRRWEEGLVREVIIRGAIAGHEETKVIKKKLARLELS